MQETAKQYLVRFARQAGFLALAENLKGKAIAAKNRRLNDQFRHEHPDVPLPPERLMHDPYCTVNYSAYFETGKWAARALAAVIREQVPCDGRKEAVKVLEWGCGFARILRHLHTFQPPCGFELHGTDYNAETIGWCKSSLPQIDFRLNGLNPPLAYEDNFFDFAYCVSVFTHLSEPLHHAWMAELLRVIRPGGFFLLTLHGDHFRKKLLPDELKRYDAGEIVVRGGVVEGSRMFA